MPETIPPTSTFKELNLPAPMLAALEKVGYEIPTPIQAQTIPSLLEGLDVVGHAPTGTGKTAAFALPLLSRTDLRCKDVQTLVLTPTRELAIQVAEAFQGYASHLHGFHVVPIYGGQDYGGQIRQLKRGVHVVVGTPGRVMDHMRRGTLRLDGVKALVLDEADEMLRMGFIDDVEWVLEQIPKQRQIALFSATMPKEIQRIARRHLSDPREIFIKSRTATADTIRQRYWLVSGVHKLDALTRILEVEPFEALLMFVRTKTATTELAEKLEARGYAAAALNGDMAQKHREQMVDRLKRGSLDILVATDVAARGLDVDRISHVVNYDIPYDTEAYIHRIGRTGRAGRRGEAILFVAPRERRMLYAIESATRQKITPLDLPTTEMVNNKRIANFKQSITDILAAGELEFMQGLLEQYQHEHDVPALEIAAALAKLSMGEQLALLKPDKKPARKPEQKALRKPERKTDRKPERTPDTKPERMAEQNSASSRDRVAGKVLDKKRDKAAEKKAPKKTLRLPSEPVLPAGTPNPRRPRTPPGEGMERFRIEVGSEHEVKPGNIVGAIANEAGLDARHIGNIDIHGDFSLVDLPMGMPKVVFQDLRKAWVCGKRMEISRLEPLAKKKKTVHKEKKRKKLRRRTA